MEPKPSTMTGTAASAQRGAERNIENYGKSAHQAVDRATQTASEMTGRVSEQMQALSARGEELWQMKDEYVDTAREYVREHPFQALGMALAAGFVLSMLMRSGK